MIAGYTQAGKHFRAVGGKGQDPDEGEIELSYTQKHLPLITEKEWGDLFNYTNRKVGGTMAPEPAWDKYKEYHPAPEEVKIHVLRTWF